MTKEYEVRVVLAELLGGVEMGIMPLTMLARPYVCCCLKLVERKLVVDNVPGDEERVILAILVLIMPTSTDRLVLLNRDDVDDEIDVGMEDNVEV